MNKFSHILDIEIPRDTKISSASNSTKKIKKDSIFFGLQGSKIHGSSFAQEALNLGASIVVHNDVNLKTKNQNIFYVENLESKIIDFLNALYEIDINSNNFFTFTGTNGKTSAAYLCHQLLTNMGYDSIYIGTLGTQYKNKEFNNSFSSKTTPDIFELFEIINSLNCGLDSVSICIEISSHALDQKRLNNIYSFNSASILNISNDHLDYHKNISTYIKTKFDIFKINSPVKLINEESNKLRDHKYDLTCVSNKNNFSDIFYEIKKISLTKCEFNILINNPPKGQEFESKKRYKFLCNIFPEFNISNLVFAILSIGFDEFSEDITNDISFLRLPKGRAEFVSNIPANIVIDYAHNEHAFEILLSSIKNYFDKLVIVFGCGGNRDKSKRPKMMTEAIKNSSKVIFTSDNSRNENFADIFEDTKKGNRLDNVIAIEDRKEAIVYGSKIIGKNDCMVILGKGHEKTQETSGKVVHYSDHEVINEIYS